MQANFDQSLGLLQIHNIQRIIFQRSTNFIGLLSDF